MKNVEINQIDENCKMVFDSYSNTWKPSKIVKPLTDQEIRRLREILMKTFPEDYL